ncbi:YoaK family protein [Streptomyces tropicalis]|uniref:YoaK family protein n=1 Tax=Streptomyces tropicalis TaxID=3034234 RepID=A0ABT6A360_9ACTN|nr:YoaK family protein [Streptomyces tropicalis]MDF3299080.1 YoaK family protein [Streptomyces tropicalis]
MKAVSTRDEVGVSLTLFALTMTSGAVDAVTFLGLGHAFAALATGNLLLLGFGVARAPGIPVARPAVALVAFVCGASAAHVAVRRLRARGRRWFVIALAAEVAVLCAAGLYTVAVGGSGELLTHGRGVAVGLLAFAMGWRTRTMVEAAIPEMPTTVVQISLVKALADALSYHSDPARTPVLARVRRTATVFGMFVGGVVGAALLLRFGPGPSVLALTAFEACVVALYARSPRLRRPSGIEL